MYECEVDEFVPIPSADGKVYTDVRQRARAAVEAAALLMSEGYDGPQDSFEDLRMPATKVMAEFSSGKTNSDTVASVTRTPAGALYLNSILNQYDMAVVQEATQLRNYVTNRLIIETENPDARIRIKALELLGKLSDVGLFTERSEITVNNRSTVELEESLRSKIRKLMGTEGAEDATYTDESPQNDLYLAEPLHLDSKIDVDEALGGL